MGCSLILIFVSFVGLLLRKEALAQFLEPKCALSGFDDKVIGGVNATFGSLIHKRFVLTAAHWIRHTEQLSVRLGRYYTAASSTVSKVTLAIRNRLYRKAEHAHDIGFLRIDREVAFNQRHFNSKSCVTLYNFFAHDFFVLAFEMASSSLKICSKASQLLAADCLSL